MVRELPGKADILHEASVIAAGALRSIAAEQAQRNIPGAGEAVREALRWQYALHLPDEDRLPNSPRVPILETNQLAGEEATVARANAFLNNINFPHIQGSEYYVEEAPNGVMVIEITNSVRENENLTTRLIVNPEAEKQVEYLRNLIEFARLLKYMADPRGLFDENRELFGLLEATEEVDNEGLFSVISSPALGSFSEEKIDLDAFSYLVALSQLAEVDLKNVNVRVAEPLLGIEFAVTDNQGEVIDGKFASAIVSRGFSLEAESVEDEAAIDHVRATLNTYGAQIGIGNVYVHPSWIYFDPEAKRYIVTNCAREDVVYAAFKQSSAQQSS